MSDCSSTVFLPESGCSDCSAFEARLNNLETRIVNLTSTTSELKTKVTNLDNRINAIDLRLRAVEDSIESLIGGIKIPISITDINGQTVRANVFGEVLP